MELEEQKKINIYKWDKLTKEGSDFNKIFVHLQFQQSKFRCL